MPSGYPSNDRSLQFAARCLAAGEIIDLVTTLNQERKAGIMGQVVESLISMLGVGRDVAIWAATNSSANGETVEDIMTAAMGFLGFN